MLASDLQIPLPMVDRSTSAVEAAQLIASKHLPGLVVADKGGAPVAIVSSADVLRLMLPPYLIDDMSLAGVMDESGAEEMWAKSAGRTIGELLEDTRVNVRDILHVDADDSLVELAAKMVYAHALVAVVDGTPGEWRFVTLPLVMDAILAACGVNGSAA
ncbi:MAG: CBS domain-containing protein [Rhodoglobus sp.]